MNFFSLFGRHGKPMKPGDFTSAEAKASAAWIETVNPLRGMTAQRMQNLFDASRNGDTVHLQWLYQEIERIDPTLLICQQRRTGALSSLDWHVSTRSVKRTRGFDRVLADEQADALEMAFGAADADNLGEAVEHLARGFFRGFAHVLPRWSDDGLSIKGFDCLDQWNFVRDIRTGTWYWNPEALAYTDYSACRPIPPGELVTLVAPYHIDYPAMAIYLRAAVGEQGWAKFVERFGIPPVILTMPGDIPPDQVDAWRTAAEKVAQGGCGAVPNGTTVSFCDGARGVNPFRDFIHNQRELVVLMSTGGLLTSLTEAGSGTLAGGAHADTWAEVRRMDAAKVGSVMNRALADAVLARAFPGRPRLAYFAFDAEVVPTPGEVFEDAAKAKAAGYIVDQAELEERTGYKLVRDEGAAPQPGVGGFFGNRRIANAAPAAGRGAEGADGVLEAFARDTGPAAEAVKALLADPSPEAARRLLADLPKLMPDDPALAAVIAEEMAKAFGGVQATGDVENDMRRVPGGNGNGGQFTGKTNRPRGKEPETDPRHDRYGSTDEKVLAEDQQKNFKRGATALEAMKRMQGGYIDKAMYREESGWIRFDWGTPGDPTPDEQGRTYRHGHGISHILAKHEKDADKLPDVIARGEAKIDVSDPRAIIFVTDDAYVVITPLMQTQKRIITMYEPNPGSSKLERIKKYPPAPKRQGR